MHQRGLGQAGRRWRITNLTRRTQGRGTHANVGRSLEEERCHPVGSPRKRRDAGRVQDEGNRRKVIQRRPADGGGDNNSIGREQEGIPRTPLPVPRRGSWPAGWPPPRLVDDEVAGGRPDPRGGESDARREQR